MRRELVSVVVPVYFNAASLPRLVERLRGVAAAADFDLEVILVDDGSGDDSWETIRRIAEEWPRARGVRLTRNFGSQMAIAAGLRETRGDAATVLSADLQEPPELLPAMVAAWRRDATAVLAVRRSRPEGWTTRAAAGLYYRLLRRLAFSEMPPGGFDCFLIDRAAIDFLAENREIHTSLPGLLLWGGFATAIVPYDRLAREQGRSRWTVAKKIKYFLDAIISFSYAPLRWMSVFGAVLAGLAFAYAVFLVVYKVVHGQPVQGWTSMMAALAFFSGVQLLSLGILGEYLWRTLDAARARKGFLVRERTEAGEAGATRRPESDPAFAARRGTDS